MHFIANASKDKTSFTAGRSDCLTMVQTNLFERYILEDLFDQFTTASIVLWHVHLKLQSLHSTLCLIFSVHTFSCISE